MKTAEQNYRLLQEIEANRMFMLMAYRQNPKLLERADSRVKQLFEVQEQHGHDELGSSGIREERCHTELMAVESVAQRILLLRGKRVMLDADLAEMYGVPTKALNQSVRRNVERFPADFMFQLSQDEKTEVVTNCDHLAKLKYSRTLPYAFTEHGALMLGNVLKSERAVEISLLVVRTFVQLREMLSSNKELEMKLRELERKISSHDQSIAGLIDAIRQLMKQPAGDGRPIGFTANIKGATHE